MCFNSGILFTRSVGSYCLLPFQPLPLWHFSLCSLCYVNSLHIFLLFFRVPYCYLNGFYTEHFVITLCLVVISDRMFFLCSNNSHCLSPCSWFFYDFSFWISDLRYLSYPQISIWGYLIQWCIIFFLCFMIAFWGNFSSVEILWFTLLVSSSFESNWFNFPYV